jgi:hypothetical protein
MKLVCEVRAFRGAGQLVRVKLARQLYRRQATKNDRLPHQHAIGTLVLGQALREDL